MTNRGLASRWVKSRSIVGVDLQHHVNWTDEDHLEQCLASVPLVPRATHLATAKELATRWNMRWMGMCLVYNCRELRMHLVLLLSLLETFLMGWSVSTTFTLKLVRILELARGGLVT